MPMRKPLIAGNWKMFKTGPEAEATAKRLGARCGRHPIFTHCPGCPESLLGSGGGFYR